MVENLRSSQQTLAVLQAIRHGASYGYDIMDKTGLPSGTVYPILQRLEERGYVKGKAEKADPHEVKRPPRKHYSLTHHGHRVLHEKGPK